MRALRRLTIRHRILLFQLVVGMAVLSMFAAGLIGNQYFNHYRARGALAHKQLDAITRLAVDADEYSEDVSGLLVTGEVEPAEIARLQSRIETGFDDLQRATEQERDFLRDVPDEVQGQQVEFERVAGMRQLYADMNAKIEALLAMRESGQQDIAIRVFHRDIDNGLDDAFEALIASAMADEMQEIETADAEAEEVAGALGLLGVVTTALAILATCLAGFLLYRSIVRPIRKLGAGAMAIGRGDLSHRVGPLGRDELGLLAERFDEMAARIDEQQGLLLAARSHLEAQVHERTAALEVANEELRGRDRSRLRFLADISHELRTPLTVLRGEAEVTLRGKSTLAICRETLRRVVEQACQMGRLVEDLLILARSETDDIRFETDVFDLADVAAGAAREMDTLARVRGLRIETSVRGTIWVEGDRQRMKQILMIVLDNAVKYSTRDGVVTLTAETQAEQAVVIVRNPSEHVDPGELPRMFDRFYRGREAAADGSAGSGLGLSIARWMTEKQGGSIALGRAEADGIEVSLRFPAVPAPRQMPRPVARALAETPA